MSNKFDLNSVLEEAEKEMGNSTDKWWKPVEGINRVRILTALTAYSSHFKGGACLGKESCPICIANKNEPDEKKRNNPSVKFLCRLHDYSDNEIKIAQLPYSIAKALQTLQNDPDYTFNDAPMPYDIKISAEGAGTKEVKYNVTPSPVSPVNPQIMEKLAKMHTPEQIKDAMKAKKMKELGLTIDLPSKTGAPGAKTVSGTDVEYPTDEIDPSDIPFS